VSSTSSKYITGQKVMLKSGQTAKIVSIDPTSKTYQVIGTDNKLKSVKSDEIEKLAPNQFDKYQQSGPNPENPEELLIKQKEVAVDQNQ
jgi:hypothetical protein